MATFAFLIALTLGGIVLIGKDSASHRVLKLVLSEDQMKEYKKFHMIPGYAIYYLRKWAKEVQARGEKEIEEGDFNDHNT